MKIKEDGNIGGGNWFLGFLALLFIGLKLTSFINWSWWWVLSPIWIPFAILLIVLAVAIYLEKRMVRKSKERLKNLFNDPVAKSFVENLKKEGENK